MELTKEQRAGLEAVVAASNAAKKAANQATINSHITNIAAWRASIETAQKALLALLSSDLTVDQVMAPAN